MNSIPAIRTLPSPLTEESPTQMSQTTQFPTPFLLIIYLYTYLDQVRFSLATDSLKKAPNHISPITPLSIKFTHTITMVHH